MSHVQTDSYYVLMNKQGKFYTNFSNKKPLTCVSLHDEEVWTDGNKERLEFMLAEYKEWFDGKFKIVEVTRSVTTEYTIK